MEEFSSKMVSNVMWNTEEVVAVNWYKRMVDCFGRRSHRDAGSLTLSTVLPNVSMANEYSLASIGPRLWSLVWVLVSFGTCCVTIYVLQCRHNDEQKAQECDGDTRGLKSLFSETIRGKTGAQTADRKTPLGLSNTNRRGEPLRGTQKHRIVSV